jgi:uncharacterized protein
MKTETVVVRNTTKDTVLGERIGIAETSLTRIVGLLGKRGLEQGSGLLIIPSQAIHTIAMKFPIDVLFVDRKWRVVHARSAMVPNRMTGVHWRARCVIELPSGIIAQTSTEVGDQLLVE